MSYSWSYAPTNRAGCKGACKEKIEKGAVRLGVATDGPGDYQMVSYRCLACVTDKQIANIKVKVGNLNDVEGFFTLSPPDQAAVLAKDGGGAAPKAKAKAEPKAKAKAEPKAKGKAKAKAKAAAAAGVALTRPGAGGGAAHAVAVQHGFLDAAKAYNFDQVKKMIVEHPGIINVQPSGRWSALHQFAAKGDLEACKHLLEHGADPDAKAGDGTTPRKVATKKCGKLLADAPPVARAAPAEKEEEEEEEEEDDDDDEDDENDEDEEVEEEAEEDEEAVEAEREEADAKKNDKKRKAAEAPAGAPAAKKGKVSVFTAVPSREQYTVHGDWSHTLNQTNVGANNNKYFKLQVLESEGQYYVWTHWGRVGAAGQHQLSPFGNQANAEKFFASKFRSKTGVDRASWQTHDWTPVIGKYTLVEAQEEEGAEGGAGAPLGKLSPHQIEKGQAVLKKLEAALKGGEKKKGELVDLSSQYYTLVPHNFGFALPPAINTREMVEAEDELLKFYLRMGFEEVDNVDSNLTPIAGVMDLNLPKDLQAACGKVCSAGQIKSSVDKGKKHKDSQSGDPVKAMDEHLYGAIMLYTSNAIYQDLNAALRSEDRNKIKKFFPYLRLLLEALDRLPQQNRTLWRGVSVDLHDQYKVGSTVTWWGISSCTAALNVAQGFMKGCGGKCTLFTVKTKTAADISQITFFGNEKESLLAPGTRLKVLDRKRKGNITEITIEEEGRELK